MEPRDMAIDQEARALWRCMRQDPPPEGLSASQLLDLLIGQTADLKYDRYVSRHLRDSQIVGPGSRRS